MQSMGPDSNQTPGMNLLQPTGGQNVQAGAATGGAPQAQAAPVGPLQVQIADETATDEQLDQLWVNKAKDIVERTKSDPFAQSNELSKVKAEYLKARFDKDLNASDRHAQ